MSTPVYAYRLAQPEGEIDNQMDVIRTFCQERNLVLADTISDKANAVRTPWLERPGGKRLASLLAPGVCVVVARAEAIYTRLLDFKSIVEHYQAKGAGLHIATGEGREFSADGEVWQELPGLLGICLAIKQALRSGVVGEAMQDRKAKGVRHCRWAGYGWRWTKKGKRIANRQEQEVIKKIIAWKAEGFSWYQIARHLMLHHIPTPDGREWSVWRVRRAYFAWTGASPLVPIKSAEQPEAALQQASTCLTSDSSLPAGEE